MSIVTQSHYPFTSPFAHDSTDDQYYEINIPASSGRTLRWSFTVPDKRLYVLRALVLRVPRTGTAGNVRVEVTMQRGSVAAKVADEYSHSEGAVGSGRTVSFAYAIPAPPASVFQFYTTNTGSGTFLTSLSLIFDVIDV